MNTAESRYKRLLRSIYHSPPGKLAWRLVSAVINHPGVRALIDKAQEGELRGSKTPPNKVLLPLVPPLDEPGEKAILCIVPFYGPDAASKYNDSVCRTFIDAGYKVDLIVYSRNNWRPRPKYCRDTFHICSRVDDYNRLRRNLAQAELDVHHIDDWCGQDLVQFVIALSRLRRYEFCLVSYVYLSGALDALPQHTTGLLLTHDVFTRRNSRIRESGGEDSVYFFSTTAEEEARGLARADLVLAITDKEADFFRTDLGIANVLTFPYLPGPAGTASQGSSRHSPLRVGYLASSHRPNITAINGFIEASADLGGFELLIAGSICGELERKNYPQHVRLLGFVDSLESFYSQCDLIINPDQLASGQKIKCVEALAHGLPLICTRESSQGIGATSHFHLAASWEELAQILRAAIEQPATLEEIRQESASLYTGYMQRYRNVSDIERYEQLHAQRLANQGDPALCPAP